MSKVLDKQHLKRQDRSREDAIVDLEDQLKKVELENQHLKQYNKKLEDTTHLLREKHSLIEEGEIKHESKFIEESTSFQNFVRESGWSM